MFRILFIGDSEYQKCHMTLEIDDYAILVQRFVGGTNIQNVNGKISAVNERFHGFAQNSC